MNQCPTHKKIMLILKSLEKWSQECLAERKVCALNENPIMKVVVVVAVVVARWWGGRGVWGVRNLSNGSHSSSHCGNNYIMPKCILEMLYKIFYFFTSFGDQIIVILEH